MKILRKLAQQATNQPTNQPAQNTTATPPAVPAPPTFQASLVYPGIRNGFNSNSVVAIDKLIGMLHTALHYTSNGSVNFQTLRNNNFNVDPSASLSVDQRNLTLFSQAIFKTLLNNGNPFQQPLTGAQVQDMLRRLSTSAPLNALSQTNPTGTLAQKFPGNLKTNIMNILQYLASANPITR